MKSTGTRSSNELQWPDLKSYCSVEGYYGSLHRAHDVLTDICDGHVIWWPRRGWTEWIRNLCTVVMTPNDLCTCIVLTKWDGPATCVNVIENVENFRSKFDHFTATQTSVTVSVKQREHDKVTRCTFSVDFKEIKTISQSLPSKCAISFYKYPLPEHSSTIWVSFSTEDWMRVIIEIYLNFPLFLKSESVIGKGHPLPSCVTPVSNSFLLSFKGDWRFLKFVSK